ncbi:HEPN domain protein [Candidatus Desulfarcum epimagneticum]|uniref:HEPN domain protein n=1 Tax=uncultured Desulfobacteraceae bacterium TaxID=218296 RepID=A0A484HG69_9BACT|nr:HEPN domain protein [uncultured Desulfobacteraceae bacterium]
MKDETKTWAEYSGENLESARILLESRLFNPCLQNVQQCVEKALKALLIENSVGVKKTHSISKLKTALIRNGLDVPISDDDCDFLDSIYIPSKYPVSSILPYFEPDLEICEYAISIAESVFNWMNDILSLR